MTHECSVFEFQIGNGINHFILFRRLKSIGENVQIRYKWEYY